MSDIKVTSDNVYHASVKIPETGEQIYLAMEPVTADNIDQWNLYSYDMYWFTAANRGLSVVLPLLSKNPPNYDASLSEVTGFTQEEYNMYMQDLHNKEFFSEKKAQSLNHVAGGVAGFTFGPGDFISYVSKTPIIGKFQFANRNRSWITLKEFQSHYANLIMTLRTSMLRDNVCNNRGIFRNPNSIVEGGNRNVSMLLHRFVAHVAFRFFDMKFLSMSALPKMASILCRSLVCDSYLCDEDIPDTFCTSFPGFGALDKKFLIQIQKAFDIQ